MQQLDLRSGENDKKSVKYKSSKSSYFYSNLLKQEFRTDYKNTIWVGDITYIPIKNKMIYLSTFIDLYTKKVVGWSLDDNVREGIVLSAIDKAIEKEKPKSGFIVHTDRGSQYTGHKFRNRVLSSGGIISNSRPGNPYDNAVIESFHKTIKTELIYVEKFDSIEKAKNAIFEYIEMYYNTKRLHSSLGYLSPIQFEIKNC